MLILHNKEEILRRTIQITECVDPYTLKKNKNIEELAIFSKTLSDEEIRLNTVSCKIIL